MNLEILFQGKRIDNNEWVEGLIIKTVKGSVFIVNTADEYGCGICIQESDLQQNYEVDPSTVRQFTGLYTVAEKKIWSGDIARFFNELYIVQRECDTPGGYWAETGYILKQIGVDNYLPFTDTIDGYNNEICIEIIGNIYDNPELLGG